MLQDKEWLFNCNHEAGWTKENKRVITVQLASAQGDKTALFIWQRKPIKAKSLNEALHQQAFRHSHKQEGGSK